MEIKGRADYAWSFRHRERGELEQRGKGRLRSTKHEVQEPLTHSGDVAQCWKSKIPHTKNNKTPDHLVGRHFQPLVARIYKCTREHGGKGEHLIHAVKLAGGQ